MKKVSVEAQEDFLEKLVRRGRAAPAIAELVWNGLDADATVVSVQTQDSLPGVPEEILVIDDGHGFAPSEVEDAFRKLGGSWKSRRDRTRQEGRILHGKDGQGRFRAFGLGAQVEWDTRARGDSGIVRTRIRGTAEHLRDFIIDDPVTDEDSGETGTTVRVTDIWEEVPDLHSDGVKRDLTEIFALYLRKYPQVRIGYLGETLNPAILEDRVTTYELGRIEVDGTEVIDAQLTVVEWATTTSRSLYLCDADGFTLARVAPYIHAPGFHFTAYLRTSAFRELVSSISLAEAHPGLQPILDRAKDQLRDHFRERSASQVHELVETWKSSDIYPYQGEAASPVEVAERQVFEVVAYNLASYMPSFADAEKENQQLSFRLLRQAIEENPQSLQRILSDVLRLPKDRQDELAELLDRTSLSAVITAAKEVADRLDFLRGLELLVFEPETKKQLLERSQLHRVLATATWIFGEEYHLSVDDQSLTEVLRKHLEILRKENDESIADNIPADQLPSVLREDSSEGIVDLMLSQRIPQPRAEQREHLVVELKRPTQAINPAVAQQVRSYAYAIQRDERFRHTDTRWTFWALSNRVTEQVQWEMEDQDAGVLKSHSSSRMTICIKTWGEVIDACRARLTFFQERLQYVPSDEHAVGYLRRVYEKYIPDSLKEEAAPKV